MDKQLLVDYTVFEVSPQAINESLAQNNGKLRTYCTTNTKYRLQHGYRLRSHWQLQYPYWHEIMVNYVCMYYEVTDYSTGTGCGYCTVHQLPGIPVHFVI